MCSIYYIVWVFAFWGSADSQILKEGDNKGRSNEEFWKVVCEAIDRNCDNLAEIRGAKRGAHCPDYEIADMYNLRRKH